MTNIEDIKSIDFSKVASRVVIPRDIFDMPREKGKSDIKPCLTLEAFEPYIDEDIQDDMYVPGITEHIHRVQIVIDESKKLLHPTVPKIQKITDQKKLPTQDTSRGAREE